MRAASSSSSASSSAKASSAASAAKQEVAAKKLALTQAELAKLKQIELANLMAKGCCFGLQFKGLQEADDITKKRFFLSAGYGAGYFDGLNHIHPYLKQEEIAEPLLAGKIFINVPLLFHRDSIIYPITKLTTKNTSDTISWSPEQNRLYTISFPQAPPHKPTLTEEPMG